MSMTTKSVSRYTCDMCGYMSHDPKRFNMSVNCEALVVQSKHPQHNILLTPRVTVAPKELGMHICGNCAFKLLEETRWEFSFNTIHDCPDVPVDPIEPVEPVEPDVPDVPVEPDEPIEP